jgi:hypothetical protein
MAAEEKGTAGGYRFFPHWVFALGGLMALIVIMVGLLAGRFPVPDDAPEIIPYPDDGEYIPGPEWLFLLFWLPFWYFKGRLKKYLFIATILPLLAFIWLVLTPYIHKLPFGRLPGLGSLLGKARAMASGFTKSLLYAIPAILLGVVFAAAVFSAGRQAKVLGCDACHNPAMGPRMAVPPVDVAKYYNVERKMQIDVGKYRAGKSSGVDESGAQVYAATSGSGEVEGYKDADWQMRHMYEPTFTW